MKTIIVAIVNVFSYFVSGLSKRNKNRIVFGAWGGDIYGDNSKNVFEYLMKYSDLELIWIGKKELSGNFTEKSNTKFVEKGSLKSYFYALTAKYAFITNGFSDITNIYSLRGAIIVQLWHGGGIKKILADAVEDKKRKGELIRGIWFRYNIGKRTFNKCQYFITSSKEREKNILSAFRYFGIKPNRIIRHGQPRNDMLVNYNECETERLRNKFKSEFSIPVDKKIVLYLPTFRDKEKEQNMSFGKFIQGDEELEKVLYDHNAIIIEKKHLKLATYNEGIDNIKYYYDLSPFAKNIDIQELLLISDVLITDYSGVYLDFLLLDRPIIHYAYDYEYYKKEDRGFKYDVKDVAGGVFVENNEDLIRELKHHLEDRNRSKNIRDNINALMNSYENGRSCKHIVEVVLGRG